ncbi:MAG TPA: PDZ domain-containing protein [Candidatus Fimivicinus intestinavium]|nr:PDZ domain-containing protein [Candidatus Fimivicinus intestinavium]
MNKKIPLGVTIALILVAITASIAITMSFAMYTYDGLIEDLPKREEMYSGLSDLDDIVREQYYGNIDDQLLNAELSSGYMQGLGDEYSYYMTASEYVDYYNRIHGKMSGIGISAVFNEEAGVLSVAEVNEGSPAQNAGLQKGDQITQIGGTAVTADNYETLLQDLEGDKLTSIDVTYRRSGTDKTVNVMRGYSVKSVYYEMIGTVGYIRITSFYENTATQCQEALDALAKENIKSIVIDVRGTAEGLIPYAAQVIDLFVPMATGGNQAIAIAKNKEEEVIETFTSDAADYSGQICVLINQETQGAAELFACDLRDFDKAELVGEQTKGNGKMQEIFQLSDGGAIVLTTAKIFPYKSDSFDGKGVVPDVVVEMAQEQLELLPHDQDAQLQKAFEILSGV